MNRRRFIQGLLSIPFVGYVASKVDDGVALFSQRHPIKGNPNELMTAADLSEAALEDLVIEIMKKEDLRKLNGMIRNWSIS